MKSFPVLRSLLRAYVFDRRPSVKNDFQKEVIDILDAIANESDGELQIELSTGILKKYVEFVESAFSSTLT